MDENIVTKLILWLKNRNTSIKTKYEIKIIQDFARTISRSDRKLEDIDPKELNEILAKYFMQAKKLDEEDYEPSTLQSHWNSVRR